MNMATTSDNANSPHESLLLRITPAVFLVAFIGALAWAFVVGRDAQAAAELAERNEIARENKDFCNGMGFKESDSDYTRCVSGLDEIRRKQKERWDAVIAGVL